MNHILQRSEGLPEHRFAKGEAVVREGGEAGGIWVLVSGALQVKKGDVVINSVDRPGSVVGEVSLLLDITVSASVEAIEDSVLRYAADGRTFLTGDPAIMLLVATGLAERLNFVTTYLADLQRQYADAPGLSMAFEVMHRLAHLQEPPALEESERDPEPDT